PDQYGEADAASHGVSLLGASGRPMTRRRDFQLIQQASEQLAIVRKIDVGWVRDDTWNARRLEWQRKVQRGLASELDDDAIWLFHLMDVQNFFERERLEI